MLSIKKILRSKLRSSFGNEGRYGKENGNSTRVRTAINEEYKEAFRTESYTEICSKIQGQLETRINLDDDGANSLSSSPIPSLSPPSPPSEHILSPSEYLVEPRHETLISQHHHFLTKYFDTSLEAGRICDFILQNIHQVRSDYHAIRGVIELLDREPDYRSLNHKHHDRLCNNLASFASHGNPFAAMTPQRFHDLHENHQNLLHQLKSKCSKTKKQKKFTRFTKRAFAIMGCGALTISLLLLAVYSTVGIVAAPGLILSCLSLFVMKKSKRGKRESKRREEESAQMNAAARGVYILSNDFDTMSRLVQGVHDEMEHRKFAAEVCVRKGKSEAVRQVVREFRMHELGFLEQLEELENQIYLCIVDINRSRRLLIQEMDK